LVLLFKGTHFWYPKPPGNMYLNSIVFLLYFHKKEPVLKLSISKEWYTMKKQWGKPLVLSSHITNRSKSNRMEAKSNNNGCSWISKWFFSWLITFFYRIMFVRDIRQTHLHPQRNVHRFATNLKVSKKTFIEKWILFIINFHNLWFFGLTNYGDISFT